MVIICDYLQVVRSTTPERSREQEVARISGDLHQLANDTHSVVVVLSQLSRESERRMDKRPTLADLRDSGAIEQDADAVVLIYHPEDTPDTVQLLVAKNRNGPTGMVACRWDGPSMRFEA